MLGKRIINTKVAGGGGCTDIVDNYDPFGGNGVALYQLNGNANDSSPNAYNGNFVNASYTTGVFGQAGVFNGSSRVDLPILGGISPSTDFTVSCWVNAGNQSAGDNTIVTIWDNTNLELRVDGSLSNTVRVVYYSGGFAGVNSSFTLTENEWTHITVTYKFGIGFTFYKNSISSQLYSFTGTLGTTAGTNKIGQYSGDNINAYFIGSIDQVRIFDTALDPLEIEALYTEELCICDGTVDTLDILGDGSCIALYPLDGNANDLSGNYPGTPTNVSYGVGEFDLAGVFNGSSSRIATNITNSVIPVNSDFSVSCWIYIGGTSDFIIAEGNWTAWSTAGFGMELLSDNRIELSLGNNGSSGGTQITSAPITLNTWTNVTATIDIGTSLKLYINGAQASSTVLSGNSRNSVSGGFYIGSDLSGFYFNGSIDQVRFFNKALNSTEVTTLYNETACTVPNPLENASFHYDPTTLSDGSVSAWSDGGSINRDLELVSGTTTISKVTSGGIEYVDFSYSASETNVSYLRTGGSTLTTYPDYPTNTSVTFVQFVNINTVYDNNAEYPHISTIFNTLESENGAFQPHIWRSGLSFSYRLALLMNNGSRFYDIGLSTPNSDIRPYGTWKMIGITFEYNQAATSYVKIYIDGALVETWSNTGTWGVLNNTLMLGRRQFSSGNRGGYKIGDTLGFFGEAKTQSEMAEMYKLLKGKYGL